MVMELVHVIVMLQQMTRMLEMHLYRKAIQFCILMTLINNAKAVMRIQFWTETTIENAKVAMTMTCIKMALKSRSLKRSTVDKVGERQTELCCIVCCRLRYYDVKARAVSTYWREKKAASSIVLQTTPKLHQMMRFSLLCVQVTELQS